VHDDAKVAAAAAQGPEEVGVVVLAGRHHLAVGGHHDWADEVVEGEPVQPDEMADAAAERQPGDARVAERAARRGEPMPETGRVEILPERAAAACGGTGVGIDGDLAHEAQVDDDCSFADAVPGNAVAATAYRYRQAALGREGDRRGYVFDVERPRDQLGATV